MNQLSVIQVGAIDRAADALKNDSLRLLESLIVAARGGVRPIQAVVKREMLRSGCDVEELEYEPAKVPLDGEFASGETVIGPPQRCLLGRLSGSGAEHSLLLFAHPDTEDLRPEPAWETDPFVPTTRDGRLYGWGVADDLAGIAMLLQSLAVLASAGLSPVGEVTLASTPSKQHRRGISAALHQGLAADAAVYLHPAESGRGLDEIKAFTPGQLEFLITIRGRQPDTSEPAHTAFAHQAVSAFEKAVVVYEGLRALDTERGGSAFHPLLDQAIGRSANLMLSFCDFGRPESLSRLPDKCRLGGALTLLPGENLTTVMAEVEAATREFCNRDPWLRLHPPSFTWLAGVSGAETPADSELYRIVSGVLRECGAAPQINPLHTSSDIRNPIVQRGIPTVGFGPLCGGLTMSGLSDEWVDVDDLLRAIAATAKIIAAWCGVRPLTEPGRPLPDGGAIP